MRNLKRALSLALASVMLLGMMVVGTGASYADVDSADNVEAIEVMQAVGVMSGDTNGNFNPDQKVTRGEMAVVMANLLNLNVKDFIGAKTPFTDVPEWAVPYVAACYADGITAGISATQYGFNYEVTTAQAALMMMKALGYFQNAKDFGADWQVATVKQGSKIDLFDGIEAGASTAMTRNEVAQIALNTLEATMVETDGNSTDITLPGDISISTGDTKYVDVEKVGTKYGAIAGNPKDSSNKQTVHLGESLFNGDLTKDSNGVDNFGAVANVWSYKDFTGKYAQEAELYYADGVKVEDLRDDLSDADLTIADSAVIYRNSNQPSGNTGKDINDASASTELGGNGTKIALYDKDGDDVIDVISITVTYAAKVETITEDDEDTKADERKLELDVLDSDSSAIASVSADKDTVGFEAVYDDVKEGDVVLVTPKGDNSDSNYTLSIAKAESVVGTVSRVTKDSVTVGGTVYNFADTEYNVSKMTIDANKEVKLFLDADGNAIYTTSATSTDSINAVYVTYAYTEKNTWGEEVQMFQGVLTDGTIVTGEFKGAELIKNGSLVANSINKPYKYEMDGDTYVLSFVGSNYGKQVGVLNLGDNYSIDKGDRRLEGSATNFFASDVKFVYVDGSKGDLKVTVKDGVQTVKSAVGDYAVISEDGDKNKVVTTVFVNDSAATASDDLIYIAKAWDGSASDVKFGDDGKTKLYGYEAYLNGEKTTVYVENKSSNGVGFYTYTVDDTTGAYSLKKTESGVAVDAIEKGGITYIGGTYYVTADGTDVKDFDATGAKVIDTTDDGKVLSLSKLKKLADEGSVNVGIVYDKDAETISYIYVK